MRKQVHKILYFILLFCLLTVTSTKTMATEPKIIKIATILDHGFFYYTENGELAGYNVDYLNLIAQYTGWQYEYVIIDEGNLDDYWVDISEMMVKGEIDLIGSVTWSETMEEMFAFPTVHTGVFRECLYSLDTNHRITRDNYFLQEKLSIALEEGHGTNELYLGIAELMGLNQAITYVSTKLEARELLLEQEVDTILVREMSDIAWMLSYLTTVDRIPFYFVVEKGNTALIEELEQAIENIYVLNQDVHQDLLEKHFQKNTTGELIITDEETVALADIGYLNVGLFRNLPPYEMYDEETGVGSGISVEILELLSDISGIEFRYVWVDTLEELNEKIAKEEVDICASTPNDFIVASNSDVILSEPYITNGTFYLTLNGKTTETALSHRVTGNIYTYPSENVTVIFEIEEAILNLSKNGSTNIFCDPNVAKYYLHHLDVDNIESQTYSNICSDVGLGMGKHLDVEIMGLLNNAIALLNDFEVEEIIHKNLTFESDDMTLKEFVQNYSLIIILVLVLVFLQILWFVLHQAKKFRILSQKDSLTKIYNAGYFHKFITEKAPKTQEGCLFIVDIDYFKDVNDTYGHQQGDIIIKKVANILTEHFRPSDVVARLGGDEFIVFLEKKQTTENLEKRCQHILDTLADKKNEVPVTLSIGGYIFDKPMEYEELYQLADKALYEVKVKGRNGCSFSSKSSFQS